MTVWNYSDAGKMDLGSVLALKTVAVSQRSYDQNLGAWSPACIYNPGSDLPRGLPTSKSMITMICVRTTAKTPHKISCDSLNDPSPGNGNSNPMVINWGLLVLTKKPKSQSRKDNIIKKLKMKGKKEFKLQMTNHMLMYLISDKT